MSIKSSVKKESQRSLRPFGGVPLCDSNHATIIAYFYGFVKAHFNGSILIVNQIKIKWLTIQIKWFIIRMKKMPQSGGMEHYYEIKDTRYY